jgi:hypothetical protein
MSVAGGFALKGLGAGDGRLVEGIPAMFGGVVDRPAGENLEGRVPARARRKTGDWNSVVVTGVGSGKPFDCGDSGMIFSRSRREDEDDDPEVIGPQSPGGATPSST